jgi:phenylacetate-CoA ligase
MFDRIAFYRDVRARVAAYRSLCDSANIDENADWNDIPIISKSSYLLANKLTDLCRPGSIDRCHLIGASSGFSKGGSLFWPKRPEDERSYLESIEQMMIDRYGIDHERTLFLVCLAFGTWIGGMQIATAMRTLAASGRRPITVATPGLHLAEAVDIVAQFGDRYKQVVWITNPSNISLIASLLDRKNVSIPPASMSFAVVGEYYAESYREWVAQRFGHEMDSTSCLWTGYGSADTGDLGLETSATITLRKLIHRNTALSRGMFGTEDTPMILHPIVDAFIEVVDGRLVVTKDQMIPLVRYDTGDAGGLLNKHRLEGQAGLPESVFERLPDELLYVHGRASDAIVFYGTNLIMAEINSVLMSLPAEFRYGGFFQVRLRNTDGITRLHFTLYVEGDGDEALQTRYTDAIIGFLKEYSLEFATKYDALSASIGGPLIDVALKNIVDKDPALKHRYIVEE